MRASGLPIGEDAGPGLDESALVRRSRAGDLDAFDALVLRYLDRAYAAARRLMGQHADAEDLVQDAFIQALRTLDRFQPDRPFGPWFFRILVNRGLNLRRAR